MNWIFIFALTYAAEPKGDPPRTKNAFEQALESQQHVTTRERWVEIDGVRYREVEYADRSVYVKFKDPQTADVQCNFLKSPGAAPRRGELGLQVHRRSRAFVELLRESCQKVGGREILTLTLDPRIGLTLPEDEKSAIKNKLIYYSPLTGLGFFGEW